MGGETSNKHGWILFGAQETCIRSAVGPGVREGIGYHISLFDGEEGLESGDVVQHG